MIRWCLTTLLLSTTAAFAQLPQQRDVSGLKPYRISKHLRGTVRVYGNNYIPALMKRWQEGFQRLQPDVTFETNLPGSEAAMAALTANTADIVFIGREGYPSEIDGFHERFGYDPLGIEISSGSFGTPHKTFSLQVFTHSSNPLVALSLAQLRTIFGCGAPGIGGPKTWGDLGVTGPIATHPIHVYGYQFDTGMARFFNRTVLGGTSLWNDELRDFNNGRDPGGEVINAGVYILEALAKDPDGIAFANLQYRNVGVKAVALSIVSGGPAVLASPQTIWDRSYPLHRFTTLYLNRRPGLRAEPTTEGFVRYILSRQGMKAVSDDGAYTPLNEPTAVHQRHRLD